MAAPAAGVAADTQLLQPLPLLRWLLSVLPKLIYISTRKQRVAEFMLNTAICVYVFGIELLVVKTMQRDSLVDELCVFLVH